MEEQTENKEKQPAGRPAEDSRQAGSATRTERGEGEKRQDREKQPAGRQRQPESRRGQKHGPRRDSSAKASDTRRHTDEPQTADSSLTETEADEAAKLREHTPHTRAEAAAPTPEGAAAAVEEEDDNVATAEEMEAFIRDRREKKEKKEEKREERVDVFGEYTAPENSIDPYLEPDPTLPWVKYEESLFLNRGCRNCPESYVPVSGQETHSCGKVDSCNWMRDIRMPGGNTFPCVEVRFKNNRKEFFRLPEGLEVTEGDVVAVEGMPGHDIGIVSLTGEVCRLQMEKRKVDPESESVRKLFRRAKVSDLDRWNESLQAERSALLRTREIATSLGL